jgi:hypothetical protein
MLKSKLLMVYAMVKNPIKLVGFNEHKKIFGPENEPS